MSIYFPKNTGQKYYGAHYKFLYNIFKFMDLDVGFYDSRPRPAGGFILEINGKCILVDFCDSLKPIEGTDDFDVCFKYHYSHEYCDQSKNVYPLGAISFHDWNEYHLLEKQIRYSCNADRILNNQKARHGAKHRRRDVRKLLQSKYGNLVDSEITDAVHFWEKINDCLVSICVPGQRNDILDRGQFQYMAFGACTVSPKLNMTLPFMRDVLPGVHYVECADDYSDLIEKIEWCKEHRSACVRIGWSAKKLFLKTSTPNAIWRWMCRVLKINETI